ncbi:MAG: sporulation protein YqfD, partial [Clostridia bacterium]|nr:sporulation protein YqfD [Clostridia bacterium]
PPSNLIAGESGTITKIDAVSGETQVSIGDNVAKGDILVSGVIEVKDSRTFVNSSGQVFAEVQKTFTEKQKISCETFTAAEKKTKKAITFLWFKIPLYLGRENSPYKIKTTTKDLLFFGKKMPISMSKAEFTIYEKKRVKYSEDALKKILESRIDKKIADEIKGEYEVVSFDIKTEDNEMIASKTVKTVEDIAQETIIRIE